MLCLSKKRLASIISHASFSAFPFVGEVQPLLLGGCFLHQAQKCKLRSCCNSEVYQPALPGRKNSSHRAYMHYYLWGLGGV